MKKRFTFLVSSLFPSMFARIAYKKLTHPQVHKLREHELVTLDKATQAFMDYEGFQIKTYAWNESGSKAAILLVHGWEGQAGNFCDLVEELIKADYRIYSFDGPSHGFSSKGAASLFEFVRLVNLLIQQFEVKNLITHSFGSVASTYVLSANQELNIDKFLLFTSPDKFSEHIDFLADQAGVSPKVKRILVDRIEQELDMNVSELNVSNWVQNVKVKDVLILHDQNDRVLPIEQSINVHRNWKNAKFEVVVGTGHFRILRTQHVLDRVVAFFEAD